MKAKSLLAALSFIALSIPARAALPSFTTTVLRAPNPAYIQTVGPLIQDVDDDGAQDVIAAGGTSIFISYGKADGSERSRVTIPGPTTPRAIAAADLNGDLLPDLVVVTADGLVRYYLNDGATPYSTFVQLQSPAMVISRIATGDFNNDGIPDIVATGLADDGLGNFTVPKVQIYLSQADQSQHFTGYAAPLLYDPATPLTATDDMNLAVGDLNGDGFPDVAIAYTGTPSNPAAQDNTGGSVVVFFGDPGAIANSTPLLVYSNSYQLSNHPVGIAIGDINSDDRADIVTGAFSFVQNGNVTQVWSFADTLINNNDSSTAPTFNVGNNFFYDTVDSSAAPFISPAIADVDGDGHANDIVLADSNQPYFYTLGITPDLNANSATKIATSASLAAHGIALGRLNADTLPDVVIAANSSNGLGAFLNTTGTSGGSQDISLNFEQSTYTETADGSAFQVTADRGADSTAPMDVALTLGGSAISGSDYVLTSPTNGQLHFDAGVTTASLTITTSTSLATSKTITAALGAVTPDGTAIVGATNSVTVTLNPISTPDKTVRFSSDSFIAPPDGSELQIPVTRGSSSTGVVDVPLTFGGTAVAFNSKKPNAACDYIQDIPDPSVNKVHFDAGVYTTNISLGISQNLNLKAPKTISITLGAPTSTSDATLGAPKATVVTISNGPTPIPPANALTVKPSNPVKATSADTAAKIKIIGRNYSPWSFTTTQTLDTTAAHLALKVQYAVVSQPSVVPGATDFFDLNNAALVKGAGVSKQWTASVDHLPVGPTGGYIYFRTITTATGFTSGTGKAVGPLHVVPGPQLILTGKQCPTLNASNPLNFTAADIVTHNSEAITYRIKYANAGDAPATNAIVSVPIGQFVHLGAFNQPALGGVVTGIDRKNRVTNNLPDIAALQCKIPTLAPGASDSFDVVVDVFTTKEFDPGDSSFSFGRTIVPPADNIAAKDQAVQSYGNFLTATIQSPLRVHIDATSGNGGLTSPGSLITYTITAYNDATFDMATPDIVDLVPFGTALNTIYIDDGTGNFIGSQITSDPTLPLDSSTPAPGTHYRSSIVNGGRRQLKWTLDKIGAGKFRQVKFAVRVLYDVPTVISTGSNSSTTAQIVNNEYNVIGTQVTSGSIPCFSNSAAIPPVTLLIAGDPNLHPPILSLSKEAIGQSDTTLPVYDAQNPSAPPVNTTIATIAPPDGTADGNGILTYRIRFKNTGLATAKNVVLHDFINSKTTANAPVNGIFLGKSTVKLTTITTSGTTIVTHDCTIRDGSGNVIPDNGGDSRKAGSLDISLGDLPTVSNSIIDQFISYQVSASNGATFKPDPIGTVIRTGDFYLTTDGLSFPIFSAPRETFALVVKPVTLAVRSKAELPPPKPGFGPGVPADTDFFYQINVENSGDIDAARVTVSCPLPKGVLFEGFYNLAGQLLDVGDPNIGKNGTLSYALTAPLPAQSGGILRLKAHLVSDGLPTFPNALRAAGATFNFQPTVAGGYMQSSAQAHILGGMQKDATADKFIAVDDITADTTVVAVAQANYARLWLAKKAPVVVQQGANLTYTLFYGNTGNIAAQNTTVAIYVPDNTVIKAETATGFSYNGKTHVATWAVGSLAANSAGSVTMTVQVNQDSGTLLENSCVINSDNAPGALAGKNITTVTPTSWLGGFHQWWNNLLGANQINLGAANSSPQVENDISHLTQNSQYTTIGGASVIFLKNGVFIIPLGGGKVVVGGPSGTISGGTAMINGDGATLVKGTGSAINIPAIGTASGGDIILSVHAITDNTDASKAGNVLVAGNNLIATDGATLLNNDTGAGAGQVSPSGPGLVAAGGGNLVAAGGGNLVAAGGGNLVAAGGGNLASSDGSQLVAAGGGNLVAAGGGNLVAAGGGNLVAAGGGNLVAAGGSNVVAAGGGNLVAAGGGNFVAKSGSALVAAGGGN